MELEFAEERGKFEAEKAAIQNDLTKATEEKEGIRKEFNEYKTRAHSLLKSKEAQVSELTAKIKNSEDNILELRAAKEKIEEITVERDNIRDELSTALEGYQKHLDEVVKESEVQIEALNLTITQKTEEIKIKTKELNKLKENLEDMKKALLEAEEKTRDNSRYENL